MPYCPICGTDHDPDLPCADKTSHLLRRAGIDERSRMSADELAELSRKARKSVIPAILSFLLIVGTICLGLLLIALLRESVP
jgi:hypothetical protein